MAKFDNILGTVGNTPVVRINKLAPKGINLYVKVEAFNPLGSVKDRLALGVIEAAEKSGELTDAELSHTIFPHPTLSEMMKEAVLDAYGRVLNI